MKITRDMLLEKNSEDTLRDCEFEAQKYLSQAFPRFTIFRFADALPSLKKLCCWNGGDEDWMVIAKEEPTYVPPWLDAIDVSCDPDVYVLNGVVIYVGSHS